MTEKDGQQRLFDYLRWRLEISSVIEDGSATEIIVKDGELYWVVIIENSKIQSYGPSGDWRVYLGNDFEDSKSYIDKNSDRIKGFVTKKML